MKDKIRIKIKQKRNNLLPNELKENSKIIKEKLFTLSEFKKANTVLFYISYNNEVFTHDMIKESLSTGKHVVVPYTDKKNRRLILSKLSKWNELVLGAYNILEPKRECIKKVTIDAIDLVIVPGVAFDVHGHRIGHGMGYYDRLLENSKHALHMGLAFELQLVEKIPADEHDVAVDKIVTEKRIITCQAI